MEADTESVGTRETNATPSAAAVNDGLDGSEVLQGVGEVRAL